MLKFPSQTPDTHPIGERLRAALILDRFTRSLIITFATNTAGQILGTQPEHLKDKSIYDYIHNNSLTHAEGRFEEAKTNDSIEFFQFCLKDPRKGQDLGDLDEDDVQNEMLAQRPFQAADPTTPRNRGNRHPIPPLELEAIVFSTSDGLLVVLQHKLAVGVPPLEERGTVSG